MSNTQQHMEPHTQCFARLKARMLTTEEIENISGGNIKSVITAGTTGIEIKNIFGEEQIDGDDYE